MKEITVVRMILVIDLRGCSPKRFIRVFYPKDSFKKDDACCPLAAFDSKQSFTLFTPWSKSSIIIFFMWLLGAEENHNFTAKISNGKQ